MKHQVLASGLLVAAVLYLGPIHSSAAFAQTTAQTTAPSTAQTMPQQQAQSRAAEALERRPYRLEDLIELAKKDGLALQALRVQSQVSRAGMLTAQARPNPEIEWATGSQRPSQAGGASGSTNHFTISQGIENPALRAARIDIAKIGVVSADLNTTVLENNIVAIIKSRYFDVLKRQEEVLAAREELQLTEQIRERVEIRFRTGEGARFDLLRAETEVALADKELARANSRLAESRSLLRQAVSASLPDDFKLSEQIFPGVSQTIVGQATLESLQSAALQKNPEIQRSLSELARAEKRIELEQAAIHPGLAIRLGHDREPDYRSTRIGVAISVPIFDRKQGPIAEAKGQASRSRTDTELLRFELEQTVSVAWQQYQAALNAVQAFEGGILDRARNVVRIAEAAYRLGERGILEYLDSRRQFRIVRAELINARLELQLAVTELERLSATPLRKIQ